MPHAFIIPLVLYILGTSLISNLPLEWYPITYAVVVAIVATACWFLIRKEGIIKPHGRVLIGIVTGLIGVFLWILVSHLHLEDLLSTILPESLRPLARVSYNPFENLESSLAQWSFIGVRLLGIALVVPVIEEVFWRGFLMRWLINPDWRQVPIGQFTAGSCATLCGLFALAHPEWFAAAAYCLLLNGLLYWKRDLWLCIVAHATSNLVLVMYVLTTKNWWLW